MHFLLGTNHFVPAEVCIVHVDLSILFANLSTKLGLNKQPFHSPKDYQIFSHVSEVPEYFINNKFYVIHNGKPILLNLNKMIDMGRGRTMKRF